MTPGPVRTRLRADVRREQLLDAAVAVLIDRGVAGVSMEAVAAQAGVNKAIPYRHFDNARAVLVELFVRFNRVLGARVLAATNGADGLETRVTAAVGAFFDVVGEHDALLSIAFTTGTDLRKQAVAELDADAFVADLMHTQFAIPVSGARAAGDVVVGILSTAARSWREGTAPRHGLEAIAISAAFAAIERARVLPG